MGDILQGNAITPTAESRLAAEIDTQIKAAASTQLGAYKAIREFIYGPADHPFAPEKVAANYAAFQQYTKTGLTAEQLGEMACITKAAFNRFSDKKITDNVPEAVITFAD